MIIFYVIQVENIPYNGSKRPPISDVVSAEEVCEYTYKVELIEKDKISLVIFNTTTGIKYQTYIEEYSDLWDTLKVNFQHNFSLCLKMLMKSLIRQRSFIYSECFTQDRLRCFATNLY